MLFTSLNQKNLEALTWIVGQLPPAGMRRACAYTNSRYVACGKRYIRRQSNPLLVERR